MWDVVGQHETMIEAECTQVQLNTKNTLYVYTLNENVVALGVTFVNSMVLLIIGSINPSSVDCSTNEKFMLMS